MPRSSSYERMSVISAGGDDLGWVSAVLFHPSEPRVVGLQVDRRAHFGLIARPPAFVRLSDVARENGATLRYSGAKLPADSASERALGFSWEQSVIWRGMPVAAESGEPVGVVHDVDLDHETGAVRSLRISTGAVGDVALGRFEVRGELIKGFDGESVRVLPGYNEIRAEGGAAKAVAAGTAAVKVRGGQVADGALQVGVAASRALGRSLKHGAGRKAIDKLKSLMDDEE